MKPDWLAPLIDEAIANGTDRINVAAALLAGKIPARATITEVLELMMEHPEVMRRIFLTRIDGVDSHLKERNEPQTTDPKDRVE